MALGRGEGGIGGGDAALQLGGAGDGLDHACELGQHAIAHELHDAPAVPGDEGLDQLLLLAAQRVQRAGLVGVHQPAVVDDVGGENGEQPAFHGLGRSSPGVSASTLWRRGLPKT